MTILREFEIRVIEILVKDVLSPSIICAVKEKAEFVNYEHTNVGYFFTISHPDLPSERIVCNKPTIFGKTEGSEAGFIVFLENRELTLECHTWDGSDLAKDFRDQNVTISVVQ